MLTTTRSAKRRLAIRILGLLTGLACLPALGNQSPALNGPGKQKPIKHAETGWGYLGKSGRFEIPPNLSLASDFVGGIALVERNSPSREKEELTAIDRKGKRLFDAPGRKCVITVASLESSSVSPGTQPVPFLMNLEAEVDGQLRHEIIDSDGREYWPVKNLAPDRTKVMKWLPAVKAKTNSADSTAATKLFLDHVNEYGLPSPLPDQSSCHRHRHRTSFFSEDLAFVIIDTEQERRFGFITREGKLAFALPDKVLDVGDFHEGLAAVKVEVDPYFDESGTLRASAIGFVDTQGQMVIAPQFQSPFNRGVQTVYFSDGLACISKGAWAGAIDRKGKVVVPFDYPLLNQFRCQLAACLVLVDGWGRPVSPTNRLYGCQSRSEVADAYARAIEDSLHGFKSDKLIRFEFTFNSTEPFALAITNDVDDPATRAKLAAIVRDVPVPRFGELMNYGGRMYMVLKDKHVTVSFSASDPCASQILERIRLRRKQRRLSHSSADWQSLDRQIKRLNDQIGDERLYGPWWRPPFDPSDAIFADSGIIRKNAG